MDKVLERKIKSIIRNETGLGNERIGSAEIYDKLKAAGVEVSELETGEFLLQLEKEHLITVAQQVNKEDKEKYGEYLINWVSKNF
jgi:hypothetical protein